jgi:hypothetical protein
MPRARALRLKILRLAVTRRTIKAAAIAARFSKWLEETALRAKRTRDWLSQSMSGLRSRISSAWTWFKSMREHRSHTAEPGGEDAEPA